VLLVEAATAPDLENGAFWIHQVVGLEVVTEEGRALGRIREVLPNPANDIWVTEMDGRELLIPALKEVVREVDLAGKRVVVRLLPGLEP
jgi:16S rRNA processing protein RimM